MRVSMQIILLFACCLAQTCCNERIASSTEHKKPQSEKVVFNANNNASSNTRQKRPLSGEEHFSKANSLKDSHSSKEALSEYYLAIENGYDTVELRIEMGELLADRLNRHEEAIEQFRIAVQREGTNWRAHWPLAKSLLISKKYDEALSELQIVKHLDPEGNSEGSYMYHTAKALDGLAQYAEALKEYEAFLKHADKIRPGGPDVIDAEERVRAIREQLRLGQG